MNEPDWDSWISDISEFHRGRGILPLLAEPDLRLPFDRDLDCWHASSDELLHLCHIADGAGSPVARAATVLYCWYLTITEPWPIPSYDLETWNGTARSLLVDAVSLFPVDAVEDVATVKWELMHAACAGLWSRTEALIRRWIEIAPSDEPFAWSATARIGFLRLNNWKADGPNQEYWLRYHASTPDYGAAYAIVSALNTVPPQDVSAGRWQWPLSLSDDRIQVLLDIGAAVSKASLGLQTLETRVLAAWCGAAIGTRRGERLATAQAGQDFLRIARDDSIDESYRGWAARFATTLFRQSLQLDEARDAVVLWTDINGDIADAWNVRAGLENQLGLPWSSSYETFVRVSGSATDTWWHTELLRFSAEQTDQEKRDRALDDRLLTYEGRRFARETITFHWPTFSAIADRAQERWCSAVIITNDPLVRERLGDDWSDAAADRFAESVAIELRRRVFGPFAQSSDLVASQLATDEVRTVDRLRRGERVTLGEMVELLISAVGPKKALGRMLGAFLRRAHRPLSNFLQNTTQHSVLRQLAVRRNEAAHEHMPTETLRWVHHTASSFLSLVAQADPRQQAEARLR